MSERVLRTSLRTRGYELSSYGRVSPSGLMRYLEHARWGAFEEHAGRGEKRSFGLGVVRAQNLDILADVSFHQDLEITSWISRVGRTSFDYSHEMIRGGEIILRSTCTIVALDNQRRPRELGDDVRELLVERELANVPRPSEDPPPSAWARDIVIRPSDHDLQQHVNQARYADFVDDVRLLCASDGGYGDGAWDGTVRKFSISYERESRLGDGLVARSWRAAGERVVEVEIGRAPGDVVVKARVEM